MSKRKNWSVCRDCSRIYDASTFDPFSGSQCGGSPFKKCNASLFVYQATDMEVFAIRHDIVNEGKDPHTALWDYRDHMKDPYGLKKNEKKGSPTNSGSPNSRSVSVSVEETTEQKRKRFEREEEQRKQQEQRRERENQERREREAREKKKRMRLIEEFHTARGGLLYKISTLDGTFEKLEYRCKSCKGLLHSAPSKSVQQMMSICECRSENCWMGGVETSRSWEEERNPNVAERKTNLQGGTEMDCCVIL